MIVRVFTALLAAATAVQAAITVTSPAAGASVANTAFSVALTGATTGNAYTYQVMIGGSTEATSAVAFSAGSQVYAGAPFAVAIPATSGPLVTIAAYYVKVTEQQTGAIVYSNRFSLTGMSGNYPNTNIQTAATQAAALGNTAVPAAIAGNAGAGAGAAASSNSNLGTMMIAFSLQTGTVKTAPMQQKPGTTITAQNTAPQYPTSSWSVFTTLAPIPIQVSTFTPSATYSASSRENTASPAAMPSNDMQKYLARWVD